MNMNVECAEENKQFSDLYALFFFLAWGHQTTHAKIGFLGIEKRSCYECYDDDGYMDV